MFKIFLTIVRFLFIFVSSKNKNIIIENATFKKENEILKRQEHKKLKFKFFDRLFYARVIAILYPMTFHL
jgi:hypothetical protein